MSYITEDELRDLHALVRQLNAGEGESDMTLKIAAIDTNGETLGYVGAEDGVYAFYTSLDDVEAAVEEAAPTSREEVYYSREAAEDLIKRWLVKRASDPSAKMDPLSIVYRDSHGEVTTREVYPVRLTDDGVQTYDMLRDDPRTFLFARVQAVTGTV